MLMEKYYSKYKKYKNKYLDVKLRGGGSGLGLDKITREFVDKVPSTPIYKLSPADARNVLNNLQRNAVINSGVKIVNVPIKFKNSSYTIRIIVPKDARGDVPIVMYYHGGGWVLGNNDTHGHLTSELSFGAKVCIASVEYTPSPEADYRIILEQCYDALMYMVRFGHNYGLDVNNVSIAGDSAGGNLAIAIAMIMRGGHKIRRLALFYPVTSSRMDTPSYTQFKDGPWLTANAMKWFWDCYAPNPADRSNVLLSPLDATMDQLKNFPPTLIITDENDVLRDEGEEFGRNLMASGVPVMMARYLGTIHDFMMLAPLNSSLATRGAIGVAISFLAGGVG